MYVCTFAATDALGDTTAATEFESLSDINIETLEQTRSVEKVAEAREFLLNGLFEWGAARTWWFGGIEVISTRN